MNKLFAKSRSSQDAEADSTASTQATDSLNSESDSLKELQPMFISHGAGKFTNDTSLNLNPSISTADTSFTEGSSKVDKSLFSSGISHSTKQSSNYSSSSSRLRKPYRGATYGQTLPILETSEELPQDAEAIDAADPISQLKIISDRLHVLCQDISFLVSQYTNSVSTLSTTVIGVINVFKEYLENFKSARFGISWNFNSYNNEDVRKILGSYLHFYDNLLQDDAYAKLKLLLCKAFNQFCWSLKSTTFSSSQSASQSMVRPCNFAIGSYDGKAHKNERSITRIMAKMSSYGFGVKEQNGSFIAPITRGISKDLNVLCLYFGYRSIENHHSSIAARIHDLYDDIHVIVAKNRIELASGRLVAEDEGYVSHGPTNFSHKFKLPFRTPMDPLRPPMSLSLSTESSARISGTMGGFIYPIIDKRQQPHLESYANSKFAISCGHVCLEAKGQSPDYPYISSPSAVLISLYKNALTDEHVKASQSSTMSDFEPRIAYGSVIDQIDELFPVKRVKSRASPEGPGFRNLPKLRFGQIIWGERTLIQAKNFKDGAMLKDKRLSDLAIVKVNKLIQCDQNYLGDDVAFNEFDPSLMFDNLYVRKTIDLRRCSKESELNTVREVDSMVSTSTRNGDGTFNMNGLPVFKYGSTTKFTKGNLNGIKLVYWMDGAIHSSEFVVNSAESTTSFAAGGDSGAWILAKLEDVRGSPETKGLGVAGMLHSYDGESRQFGLFTPMVEILERLEEVTKIKWGVVGVPQKHEELMESSEVSDAENYGSASPSDSSDSDDDDSDYVSLLEDEAFPPEID